MAKVRYVGPHDAVVVPDPLGGEQFCARGDVISVSALQAGSLLDQPLNWEAADQAAKTSKPIDGDKE